MPPREIETDAEAGAASVRGPETAVICGADDPGSMRARRAIKRWRHTRRIAEPPDKEARIEVLGDRIELLEYTLNEYIDKIDAVATHATRLSVDRLVPAVEKLSRVVFDNRDLWDVTRRTSDQAGSAAPDAAHDSVRMDDTEGGPDDLADVTARLAALETRIAELPERIRVASAQPLPSPEAEAPTRAHIFAALSEISRQQDEFKAGICARLDALEDLAKRDCGQDVAARISDCERDLARIPDTVKAAAAATRPDLDALARSVAALGHAIAKGEERQVEAQAALLDQIRQVATRPAQLVEESISGRLDAIGTSLAGLPERITVATAPPILADGGERRGEIARAVSALSALTRQQEHLTTTLGQRLETLEQRVATGQQTEPDVTAAAIAREVKAQMRDIPRPGSTGDASTARRATQSSERKTAVALARIERVLATLASRDSGDPKALEDLRLETKTGAAQILNAISELGSDLSEGLAAATIGNCASQAAVRTALAELLAAARRDAARGA